MKWYNWNLSFLDLYDRIVVGYEVGDHNNNILVFNTFDKAVKDNPNAWIRRIAGFKLILI